MREITFWAMSQHVNGEERGPCAGQYHCGNVGNVKREACVRDDHTLASIMKDRQVTKSRKNPLLGSCRKRVGRGVADAREIWSIIVHGSHDACLVLAECPYEERPYSELLIKVQRTLHVLRPLLLRLIPLPEYARGCDDLVLLGERMDRMCCDLLPSVVHR